MDGVASWMGNQSFEAGAPSMRTWMLLWLVLATSAYSAENLVVNPGFEDDRDRDGRPDGWTVASPDPKLQPQVKQATDAVRNGSAALSVQAGDGAAYTFGYAYQDVPVKPNETYEFVVRCRTVGIDNPNRSVLVNLVWGGEGYSDNFISEWTSRGDWIEGRQKFRHRKGTVVRLMLLLRHEGAGTVVFDDIEVRQAQSDPPRLVKVAAFPAMPTGDDRKERAEKLLAPIEQAKKAGAEIVCLTEALNYGGKLLDIAEPLAGPTCTVLAKAAAANQIYVIGCLYERDGDYVYNTAVLFDRQGRQVGKYRKTHLHWPEMIQGVRPGTEYPVFECDFGKIGIMICYDSWIPEVSRVLALKGAEILFCPNMGYGETVGIATAGNTGAYFVSSSCGSTKVNNVFAGPDFKKLAYGGPEMLLAELNLGEPKPHYYYQWQTSGMPQSFRQMTHRTSDRILDEIAELYRTVPRGTDD